MSAPDQELSRDTRKVQVFAPSAVLPASLRTPSGRVLLTMAPTRSRHVR